MKKSAIVVLAIVTLNLGTCLGQYEIAFNFIRQKVDHFDPANVKTFLMKYLSNSYYHKPGGPILIDVGGQRGIQQGNLFKGHFFDIAKELGAYLFHTEHRYYGESTVTEDLSLENLKFLNMKQAMADLAHFIKHIKETIPSIANSKVILKGNGYAGGLAVWFKHLYPELVDGVWASSAKIVGDVLIPEIDELMADSFKLAGGDECFERVKSGVTELEDMMTDTHEDRLTNLLNLCPNFDTSKGLDVENLFYMIGTAFLDVVVLHTPANREINKLCEIVMSADGHLSGVTDFLKTVFKAEPCTDATFETALTPYRDTSITYTDSARLFAYQQCHELGWFPTINYPKNFMIFPLLAYHIMKCIRIFGEHLTIGEVNNRVKQVREFFKSPRTEMTNIFMTHGELDPWRVVGKLGYIETELIPMIGHALDLDSITSADTVVLQEVKRKIKDLIAQWIGISL